MKEFLKKLLLFSALLVLFGASVPAVSVHAQIATEIQKQSAAFAGKGGANIATKQAQDPRVVAARIISLLLTLVGTLFLVYTVYAGYLIMTSAGEEEKVTKGKATLRTAIIGVIVTLSAYALTTFISTALLEAQQVDQGGLRIQGGINDQGQRQYDQRNEPIPYDIAPNAF